MYNDNANATIDASKHVAGGTGGRRPEVYSYC